jgi:hypothetical protein
MAVRSPTQRGVSAIAVAAGIALAVALMLLMHVLQRVAFPEGGGPYPAWYAIASTLLESIEGVVPGFLAGWLARGRALVHGALVAAGSSVAAIVFVLWSFGEISASIGVLILIVGFLCSSITQSIGALAGVALRTKGAAI